MLPKVSSITWQCLSYYSGSQGTLSTMFCNVTVCSIFCRRMLRLVFHHWCKGILWYCRWMTWCFRLYGNLSIGMLSDYLMTSLKCHFWKRDGGKIYFWMIMAYQEVITSFLPKARKLKALYKLISLLGVAMFSKLKVMKSSCHSMHKLVHLTVTKLKCFLTFTLCYFRFWPNNKSRMYILEAAGMPRCGIWIQFQMFSSFLVIQTLID